MRQTRLAPKVIIVWFIMGCWLLGGSVAQAEVPQLITYQGRLTEKDGNPVVGDHAAIFRIYDAETGGQQLWKEEHRFTITSDDNGVFSIVLGSLTPFGALDFNQPMWLSLEVDGEGEMTPRQRLTAVGYAINADTLDGLDGSQFLRADVDTQAVGQLTVSRIDFGSAANDDLTASDIASLTGGAASNADALHTHVLSSFDASNLTSGTVPDARLSANVSLLGPSIDSAELTDGTVTAEDLGADSVGAEELASSAIQPGDIEAGDLPSLGRTSTSASSSMAIGTSDTTLLSVTINKTNADSALLILASVALSQSSGGPKTITVKLARDGTVLDGGYVATMGSGDQAIATVHAWDTTTSGSHTVALQASANNTGSTATIRRLTVVELP